jgi:prolyl-tRNA editing enzyme YbaK/EbsC (Cys-tRNA(Pro) deacylase)
MQLGKLTFLPVEDCFDVVVLPVRQAITDAGLLGIYAAKNDPALADTAAYCEHYGLGMDISANCVVVQAKRADKICYAACVVLATNRADINGIVRKQLQARKVSFAPMEQAVAMTGMEYGGITPIGLPSDWPILVDEAVAHAEHVIIGSGLRGSKLVVPGKLFLSLPNTTVMPIAKS